MDDMRLGGVIAHTFRLWKKLWLPIGILFVVPGFIGQLYTVKPDPAQGVLMAALFGGLLNAFLYCFVSAGAYQAASTAYHGNKSTMEEMFQAMRKKGLKYILAMAVMFVIIMLCMAILFTPMFFILSKTNNSLVPVMVFSALALVALAYVMARYCFIFPVISNENVSVRGSLKRSKELVKGERWRILGYISVVTIITMVPYLAASRLLASQSQGVVMMVMILLNCVVYSVAPIFYTVLYYSRKKLELVKA